jgi:G3E family GTPase
MTQYIEQDLAPIPIILISGYLGSGKTTYLNQLLAEVHGRKLAIFVNDFGAINIDASLVSGAMDGVIALQNGCICCSVASGMQSAIFKALKREDRPEAIVIEASGVANPGEIARILGDDAIRPFASLEIVISMLDCVNAPLYGPEEVRLIREQLRYSNIVMLTKLDQAAKHGVEYATALMQETNPGAVIIKDYQKILNLDLLLGTKQPAIELNGIDSSGTNANDLFKSWSFSETDPMSESEFQRVLKELPPETVRGKGFLNLKDYPEVRFEFQMVGKSAQVQPNGEWGLQKPRTEIVFIALK